jgi:hypothetical protein
MTLTLIRDVELDLPTVTTADVLTTTEEVPFPGRLGDAREPRRAVGERFDVVHEWGVASFPASDPPANW